MRSHKLTRDKNYSLQMINNTEGTAANFLTIGGNYLQIAMSDPARSEVMSIRRDTMKAGFIHDGPLILWVFTFGSIFLECPFDARIIPSDSLHLPDITNDAQRLGVDIHLVDTATMMLRAIRYVTLSPELTRRFLAAVDDQLGDTREIGPILAKYKRQPITALPHLAQVQRCGP